MDDAGDRLALFDELGDVGHEALGPRQQVAAG
jgi:hypothetical protein